MPRLFTALELPDDIRDELAGLKMPVPGARWIDRSSYHLTLRFVGDISPPQARELAHCLGEVDQDAFEITLAGLGCFGGNEPRSLWCGVRDSEPLADLARAHERAARRAGLKPEGRKFAPHVTLARLDHPRSEALSRCLHRHAGYSSAPIIVDRFVLMSSRPHTGGGPYGVEEVFPLAGAMLDEDEDGRW